MKGKWIVIVMLTLGLLLALAPGAGEAQGPEGELSAQALPGTGFTYQGQLKDTGGPVTGLCDFQFGLWNASANGAQVGTTQTVSNVSVTNGLFTAQLDFGSNAFTGNARWLEIAVQCSGDGGFTILSPRQALTPAPYALALPGLFTRQNATSPNLIGGYNGNSVTGNAYGATISGGGSSGNTNRVTDNYGTVGGGRGNQAGDNAGTTSDRGYATVGGGYQNMASGPYATVGGGSKNVASGQYCPGILCFGYATVGGGVENTASGFISTIGGGYSNQASADYATIAGGGRSDLSNPATRNRVTDNYGTIGGGGNNQAGNDTASLTDASYATVSGGLGNAASSIYTTVGGGNANAANRGYATIAGGNGNSASAQYATVGGGNSNEVTDNYGTVGGGSNNQAGSAGIDPLDAEYATVGGGSNNQATDGYATIAGGASNTASGQHATVGGGMGNEAAGWYATIAGGGYSDPVNRTGRTRVTDNYGTVGGGGGNQAGNGAASRIDAIYATVGGGYSNMASGDYATIAGGFNNTASGDYSFASGRNANASHNGAFVWSDGTRGFSSSDTNGFHALATGGFRFYFNAAGDHCDLTNALAGWQCFIPSDRDAKEHLAPVDGRTILARLATIPIQTWNYANQDSSIRHIGPMAQDWAALGFSEKDTEINAVDAVGIALAATQGLYQTLQEKDAQIADQQKQITALEARLSALEQQVQSGSRPAQPMQATMAPWLVMGGLLVLGIFYHQQRPGRGAR
jgi:hypothetical protein